MKTLQVFKFSVTTVVTMQKVVIGGREGALVSVKREGLLPDVACLQCKPDM